MLISDLTAESWISTSAHSPDLVQVPDGPLEAVDDRPDLLRIMSVAVIVMVFSLTAVDVRILMVMGMIMDPVVCVKLS